MKTYDFHPQFRNDVAVIMAPQPPDYPEGFRSPVNPHLCLTGESAAELASVLEDLHPAIVERSPTGPMYGIFRVSSMVPGFVFPDGSTANCGDLAMWWVRCDPATAERMARLEIAAGMRELQALKDQGRTE